MLAALLFRLYSIKKAPVRRAILRLVRQLEGGEMQSQTLRRIFACYHQVEIGLYSYGGCFKPGAIAPFTKIGRYCSFADGVRVFNADHPLHFKSTHPFFYNPVLGYVTQELIPRNSLMIGNDVWVGYNTVILANVHTIGDGAVIGVCALVTKDVPDFAVVAGNPAKVIKYRFPQETIERIKATRWWDKDIEQLKDSLQEFLQPLETDNETIHTN